MLWIFPMLLGVIVAVVAVKLVGNPGLLFGIVASAASVWWGRRLTRPPVWEDKEPPAPR